jgi:hypothetical protein
MVKLATVKLAAFTTDICNKRLLANTLIGGNPFELGYGCYTTD